MTNEQIIESLEVGDIVTNKQILSALKRKGLIYGYSGWGYLESCWIGCKDEKWPCRNLYELFPDGNAPKEYETSFDSVEEFDNFSRGGHIDYMGCEFRTKYLDGCFSPYLQLVCKYGDTAPKKSPSMSIWGVIA